MGGTGMTPRAQSPSLRSILFDASMQVEETLRTEHDPEVQLRLQRALVALDDAIVALRTEASRPSTHMVAVITGTQVA